MSYLTVKSRNGDNTKPLVLMEIISEKNYEEGLKH